MTEQLLESGCGKAGERQSYTSFNIFVKERTNMDKRLKEINDRKLEIRSMLQGEEKVDLNALEKELADLEAEATELRRRRSCCRH